MSKKHPFSDVKRLYVCVLKLLLTHIGLWGRNLFLGVDYILFNKFKDPNPKSTTCLV